MASREPNDGVSADIMRLPTEIHYAILSLLSIAGQASAGATCRFWHSILCETSFADTRYRLVEYINTNDYYLHKLLFKKLDISGVIITGEGNKQEALQIRKVSCAVDNAKPPTFINITHCSFLDEPMARPKDNEPVKDASNMCFDIWTYNIPPSRHRRRPLQQNNPTQTKVIEFLRGIANSKLPTRRGISNSDNSLGGTKESLTEISFSMQILPRFKRPRTSIEDSRTFRGVRALEFHIPVVH
ncbi:hypothetical protein TWF694_004705 [Orbilia ellipsospora]|uniref:F-box domain-containing protein n=1 Tax=Orbilia ellipsospora TaxID=2528407 RepID=A0AAV9WY61_9PEZI